MAQKLIYIEGVGEVLLSKRRGSKNIRLSINPKGQVRINLPSWVPYATGVSFARTRTDWINKHLDKHPRVILKDKDRVGKSNRLNISVDSSRIRPTTRISNNEINIKSPWPIETEKTQSVIVNACNKALKSEAENLLPQRLAQLARHHGYKYNGVEIRKLSSRWGSCSSKKQIKLSFYLMQLPWHLIDYVLIHELTHTEHMDHGQKFWQRLESVVVDAKKLKKEINTYKPHVFAQ